MLPWLMERGDVPVSEVAQRFDVSEAHLVRDLEVASMCGLPPYVDEMIDLYIEDGVVHVGVPRLFTRPFRLSAPEGFSLLTAGRAALAAPGADRAGPLGRALDKLGTALGADEPAVVVDVERPPMLEVVQRAVVERERLAIRYYAAWRGELTERGVNPQAVFAERGEWYVVADDSLSGEERTFRVDRIEAATATGEHFDHREIDVAERVWFEGADATAAVLELPPSAAWVAETYPVTAVTRLAGGRLRVELPVMGERWLERLLLRAGPDASVLEPTAWADLGRDAARRLLERYRDQR
jgi:proteasome accessory factor C